MEGMRDAALADYENLPYEEQDKIHNDFKEIIAYGSSTISDFTKFFQKFVPEIVDKLLQNCEGYEEGRLDFSYFITVKYVLEKHAIVSCNGCWSLILGRHYFSCYECFFDFSVDRYDLCIGCYRSRKFEDHQHKQFYDNQKLKRLCRRMFAEKKEDLETINNHTNRAIVFAGKCSDFARSITTDGLETYFDYESILNFQMNKKLWRDSKEPEEKEEDAILATARLRLKPQEVRPPIDLMGASPSVMVYTGSSQQ